MRNLSPRQPKQCLSPKLPTREINQSLSQYYEIFFYLGGYRIKTYTIRMLWIRLATGVREWRTSPIKIPGYDSHPYERTGLQEHWHAGEVGEKLLFIFNLSLPFNRQSANLHSILRDNSSCHLFISHTTFFPWNNGYLFSKTNFLAFSVFHN